MKISTKYLTLAFMVLFVASCTTTRERFQEMSQHDRANYVCSRDYNVVQSSNAIEENEKSYKRINTILLRGYRIHSDCKIVTKEVPGEVVCVTKNNADGDSIRTCSTPTTTQEVCVETPVAIDYENEKSKRNYFMKSLEVASQEYERYYKSCYSQVVPMTPDSAYNFFSEG
jgi:hypothetical protein